MPDATSIPCSCGHRMRLPEPAPGERLRCPACGQITVFAGNLEAVRTPPGGTPSGGSR